MNFNFSEIFTNVINYLVQYLVKTDTELPWLKFTVLVTIVLIVLTKIKVAFENRKRIKKNIDFLKEHKKNSTEIQKKNFLEKERHIMNSDSTYLAFHFNFLNFRPKEDNSNGENPNFTKLVLSFFSDINLYRGTFIKTKNSEDKQYYFLNFDLQEDAINFLQSFEKSVEDFSPILYDFGYEITYKTVIDNREKNQDIEEITSFLKNILKILPNTGIYSTMFFKEIYDRNADNKVSLSFNLQGRYMINSETVELYHLGK